MNSSRYQACIPANLQRHRLWCNLYPKASLPRCRRRGEPFQTLRALTDPFLNTFRGIIPPIAGIDLSVMLGFFGLQFLRNYLVKMAIGAA